MIWKARYELRGAHIHVRLFVAPRPLLGNEETFASVGELVMSPNDWHDFKQKFPQLKMWKD